MQRGLNVKIRRPNDYSSIDDPVINCNGLNGISAEGRNFYPFLLGDNIVCYSHL